MVIERMTASLSSLISSSSPHSYFSSSYSSMGSDGLSVDFSSRPEVFSSLEVPSILYRE